MTVLITFSKTEFSLQLEQLILTRTSILKRDVLVTVLQVMETKAPQENAISQVSSFFKPFNHIRLKEIDSVRHGDRNYSSSS